MAKQTVQSEGQMEKVGVFNLVPVDRATCEPKLARLIHKAARDASSKKGITIPGNAEHIRIYNRIFNLLLNGKMQEVKAVYKDIVPAGSLSQVGPIMGREIMMSFRQCIDDSVYTVKIQDKPPVYKEKIEWQIENGMREPKDTKEEEHVRPGGIWECLRCGSHMATPEPVLQPVCAKCAEETGKGKSKAGAKKNSAIGLMADMKRFAQGFLSRRGTPTGDAILVKINELRATLGLDPVSNERALTATTPEELI